MKAHFNILYNRKKTLDKKGEALIHIQVYISDKEKPLVSTGVKIKPEFWDDKNKCVDYSHANAITLNDLIRAKMNALMDFESDLLRKKKTLTAEKVRDFIKSGSKLNSSFNSFYEIKLKSNMRISNTTSTDQKQTLDHLNFFRSDIRFDDIDQNFIDEFADYLYSVGLAKNTITKHYKNIKKYLNLAIDNDLYPYEQYRKLKFREKYKASKKIYLRYVEIDRIEDLVFQNHPRIYLAKLAFLLSCYTGLRYSDIRTMEKTKVIDTEKGLIIDLQECYKTDEPVYLPTYELFAGRGEDILKKILGLSGEDYPLIVPRISNSEANAALKIIAKEAKITKHLTYHISRHTFGTMLAYESGNQFTVMQYMGLSKPETALQYIHLARELGDEALKGIKWKIKRRT